MSTQESSGMTLVSWKAYAACLARKTALCSGGALICLAGITGVVISLLLCAGCILHVASSASGFWIGLLELAFVTGTPLLLGVLSLIILWNGGRTIANAVNHPAVHPPTRKNLGFLSPASVLVRAAEPSEETARTLLRATFASSETPADQLLRSSLCEGNG